MNYKNNSFDICLDKGTYDALAVKYIRVTNICQCGADKTPLKSLVQEMVRVAKKAVVIVSSGTPDKRMKFLKEYTQNKHKIEYFELELSSLA